MKTKTIISFLFVISMISTSPALADVQIGNMSAPSSITDPLSSGFTITYSLFGSKFGVGAASAQLSFYLSTSTDGSTGVFLLDSRQILLNGSGLGPYFPPSGTQSTFISPLTLPSNTRAFLQSFCQPRSLFILGQVDFTPVASTSSAIGHIVPPDFFFTSGTISPVTISPGGTTNIAFNVFTACPANSSSRVGIFLADANFNLLSFIGAVSLAPGAGTFSLGPFGITFSSSIPPGNYNIVLIADVDGVVAESDENNNAGAFALTISSAASPTAGEKGILESDMDVPVDVSNVRDLEPSTDYNAKLMRGDSGRTSPSSP